LARSGLYSREIDPDIFAVMIREEKLYGITIWSGRLDGEMSRLAIRFLAALVESRGNQRPKRQSVLSATWP